MCASVVVDLGCGRNKHPDATLGIDNRRDSDADLIADLSKGVPLTTGSVTRCYAFDVLEHISDGLVELLTEVHRILEPGGKFVVRVPHEREDPPSTNPLHKRTFQPAWFYSWDPERDEHVKWDNFTCVPFTVEQTETLYYDSFPERYYKIRTREFTLTKRENCPTHPVVVHE